MELWQTAAQELEHLQQVHQKTISDGKIHNSQKQQLKVQCFCIKIEEPECYNQFITSKSAFHQ